MHIEAVIHYLLMCVQAWDSYTSSNAEGAYGGELITVSSYGLYTNASTWVYQITFTSSDGNSTSVMANATSNTNLQAWSPRWGASFPEANTTVS